MLIGIASVLPDFPVRFFSCFIFFALVHPCIGATDSGNLAADLPAVLNFEADHRGSTAPTGWRGGPVDTLHLDDAVTHGGKWAARIDRTSPSSSKFSHLTKSLPMDVTGTRVELRGFIRTESVSEFAGLWMREDGVDGVLEFENMQSRKLSGTTDWTEYSISLPLNPKGRTLLFGFLVGGTGRAWVDDLQLLVDGRPFWEAPKATRVETVLDRDHDFDKGSLVTVSELSDVQIENLATLGRVWGFLKYHHPKVAAGELHWDYELFRFLPVLLAAKTPTAANEAMVKWIDDLGELDPTPPARLDETDLHLRPDNSWIEDDSRLGAALGARLRAVHAGRPVAREQFYVSFAPGVGNPVFEHELAYPAIKTPDAGYQLLALFRFWNIIRYWFPYRDLIDENWDAVLAEFIPRIALAKTADAYQLELFALIAKVGDSHANLWSSLHVRPPVGDSLLPVKLRFVEGHPVITSTLADVGLQRADVITSIDGVSVRDLIRMWSPYYAASNEAKRLHDIARSMTRGPAGPMKLQVERAGKMIEMEVLRVPIASLPKLNADQHDLPGPAFRLLSKDVAYLKLSAVKAAQAGSYVEQAAGTKGWIIDIRNYPAEFVVFALGTHFVAGPTSFARFSRATAGNPGAFYFKEIAALQPKRRKEIEKGETTTITEFERSVRSLKASNPVSPEAIEWQTETSNRADYTGKLVILVDETSLSQAEYTAMAFRSAPKAMVVGSTTAGADGNVSSIPLPGGLRTMISGIGIFHPDKRPTQRIGIVPDVEVRPTLEGIRLGRDEVLEEALRQIVGTDVSAAEILKLAKPVD